MDKALVVLALQQSVVVVVALVLEAGWVLLEPVAVEQTGQQADGSLDYNTLDSHCHLNCSCFLILLKKLKIDSRIPRQLLLSLEIM
jgi:hypothetical protein